MEERIKELARKQLETSKAIKDLGPQIQDIQNMITKLKNKKPKVSKVSAKTFTFLCENANEPKELVKIFAGMSLSITSRAGGTDYICIGFSPGECRNSNYKLFAGDTTTLNLSGVAKADNPIPVWVSSNVNGSELSYLILTAKSPIISVES